MTTADRLETNDLVPAAMAVDTARGRLGRIEAMLERWGERLNPILVKEARQAMKSRQFSITFALLLICGWGWSIIGVALTYPGIYYAPTGIFMLTGYYFILALPMLLVVPFSAFRSLASEREDGTYELLSISTLGARQMVTGKLGSAILQMLVYYSAIAPCIAFTYLLRGIDVISIGLLLFYTFCVSVILSAVGLVFAGLARSRQWQVLVSVVLLLGLAAVAWAWGIMVAVMLSEGIEQIPKDAAEFWWIQMMLLTAWATYVVLLVLAAAAQNSFPSDNRSTRIRIAMLTQTVLFVGWTAYGWVQYPYWELLTMAFIFAAAHWYVYGVLMSGESARLSPRVRRQLPMSFLGRVFLTWFNPGSGTGYVFAIANVTVLLLCLLTAVAIQSATGFPETPSFRTNVVETTVRACLLTLGYLVAYLGVGRLLILLIPRREQYGLLLPFLIQVLLAVGGCAVPFFIASAQRGSRWMAYSPLQTPNWLWTLTEGLDRSNFDPFVEALVYLSAFGIFLLNLALTSDEIETVRTAAPTRVLEEEGAA